MEIQDAIDTLKAIVVLENKLEDIGQADEFVTADKQHLMTLIDAFEELRKDLNRDHLRELEKHIIELAEKRLKELNIC